MTTIEFNNAKFILPTFREENKLQTFTDYAVDFCEQMMTHQTGLNTIRCSVSGFPIAMLTIQEIRDSVRHGVRVLGLEQRLGSILHPASEEEIVDGIESLLDHIEVSVLLSARRAPSLTFERGKYAIDAISEEKQLSILLNQFLFGIRTVVGRNQNIVEDETLRLRVIFAIADMCALRYDQLPVMQDLRLALIELDAKYRIAKLQFSRKERERFESLKNMGLTLPALIGLLDFVTALIVYRDKTQDVETTPATWTTAAYAKAAYDASTRIAFSNIASPKFVEKASAKPVTPEQQAKKVNASNMLASLRAALNIAGVK